MCNYVYVYMQHVPDVSVGTVKYPVILVIFKRILLGAQLNGPENTLERAHEREVK